MATSAKTTAEVDEGTQLEDMVRVALRRGLNPATGWRPDTAPSGQPAWATPLTVRSEISGREFMLEVKAVECTGWRDEQ